MTPHLSGQEGAINDDPLFVRTEGGNRYDQLTMSFSCHLFSWDVIKQQLFTKYHASVILKYTERL